MKYILPFLSMVLLSIPSIAQVYDDHFGAGHEMGIKVTSSPHNTADTSQYTLTGTKQLPDLAGASRFLSQATMGVNYEEIENVTNIGIEAWLDQQYALPVKSFATRYDEIFADIQTKIWDDRHFNLYGSFVFYDFIFNEPDKLRQKVAFALSQIFVVSKQSAALDDEIPMLVRYHDFFHQGAFGNYRDILGQVAYSLTMGRYLSHFQNQRADLIGKTFPDENFAREILQLFSIGLHQLNLDGTLQLDADGKVIPTYDIENVAELAKIFTGLAAELDSDGTINDNFFDISIDELPPMIMFNDYHSVGDKNILPGVTIPAGQNGIDDIEQALDAIFNHQNVGPFMAIRLIQNLVKSNPSSLYVKRVASVFNDNGQGVRGDLGAMVKAVLLDPEARECDWIDHPQNGKLIQPIERFTTLFNAFDISSPSDTLWFYDVTDFDEKMKQAFQYSPSVFNYFSPLYAEDEFIAPLDLVSPEFQILDAISSIGYINELEDALKKKPFSNKTATNDIGQYLATNNNDEPILDFTDEINIYNSQGVYPLLDRLDILICRGQLSQSVKDIIANTINQNEASVSGYDSTDAVHDALYYIFISPDYMIQK